MPRVRCRETNSIDWFREGTTERKYRADHGEAAAEELYLQPARNCLTSADDQPNFDAQSALPAHRRTVFR